MRFVKPGADGGAQAAPSLLVRAAELQREKPAEDEATRLAREEQEILRSITAR